MAKSTDKRKVKHLVFHREAGTTSDFSGPIEEAKSVARELAEKAALEVKAALDSVLNHAGNLGAKEGEVAGKAAGEETGAGVAVAKAVAAAQEAAAKCAVLILENEVGACQSEMSLLIISLLSADSFNAKQV